MLDKNNGKINKLSKNDYQSYLAHITYFYVYDPGRGIPNHDANFWRYNFKSLLRVKIQTTIRKYFK